MTILLTITALVAFAANSLLTRFALGAHAIDAASFTAIRLLAGAFVLLLLTGRRARTNAAGRDFAGAAALFMYAAPFSFAYLRIGAATGALVLFSVVQTTMVIVGVSRGERPRSITWFGLLFAIGGLAILTLPSLSRPDPTGLLLMTAAGVAWAAYTLIGKRAGGDPLVLNARSFVGASLPALVLAAIEWAHVRVTSRGVLLALTSGGVTSGVGYAIWYRALPRLTVMQAAVAQLAVPALAAAGAAAVLNERLSPRYFAAAGAIFTGIALVSIARSRR